MDSIPWKHILGDKLAGGEGTRVELHPIVEAALVAIETHGLDTQGLFRVPGSASQVRALKEVYKTKKKVPDLSETDSNTVCSLLTDHLRSEEPLLTYALASRWMQSSGLPDLVVRLTKYVDLINQLPLANHATLFAILRLLVLISQHAEKTLMPATNLGTIFGPMICRRLNADIAQELGDIPAVSKLCIDLITHFSQLFDYYDLDAPPGGGAVGGAYDGLATDSPRTKKTTRRKFQFGKEKPASGNTWSPSPGSSSTSPTSSSPSALSAFASVTALAPGGSCSPVVPLQSPLVPAPEYEPSAAELDDALCPGPDGECSQDHNGRARKNAMYSKQPDQESGEGAHPRSPKAQGGLASVSLELEEDRASGGSKLDGKSVMRSLSLMGGFYSKAVSKTLPSGGTDLETSHSSADVEDVDDEGKDADKKDKKRLPALNIKKRKNSIDKKKLRMFSPRKLFDKDRGAKSSPDGTSDPSELKYYDGSSSSEREEHLAGKQEKKFGGRKIPFRSAQRKSSSWPEAELLELRQAADSAREDESDDNSSCDEDGADSEASTPTSTSARMRDDRDNKGATQHRMRSDTGESRSMEIEVVKAQNRKGSQSERGPSASARAAARGGKSLAASSLTADNLELQIRRERELMASSPRGNDDERLLQAKGMWLASSPRNPATTNILVLKSPRIVGEAAALDDALRSQETVVGHLAPEEELGMVKWKKRMTVGSARRREAATATSAAENVQTAVKGDGDKNHDDDGEGKENDEHHQQTGVAFLLSKYYVDGHSNGVSTTTSTTSADARTRPRERPTVRLEGGKQQTTTTDREKAREGGNESDVDTENEDEVDDDGGTTTEDEGSGGSGNASSGEEKGKRRRESDKPRRRTSSRKLNGSKKATTKDSSSGLKLGRKVKRGEEEASDDEGDQLAPPLASPTAARIHSPRPRPSEDHIGNNSSNSNNSISGSHSSVTHVTID